MQRKNMVRAGAPTPNRGPGYGAEAKFESDTYRGLKHDRGGEGCKRNSGAE